MFGQNGVGAAADGERAVSQPDSQVQPAQLEPGDLVFFATVAPGASHVGIAIGGDEFVHAPSSTGEVRVERMSAPVLVYAIRGSATGPASDPPAPGGAGELADVQIAPRCRARGCAARFNGSTFTPSGDSTGSAVHGSM